MPVKQSSSKKTERSDRTPKKGAVRTHAKRNSARTVDTGLLEDLHRRSCRRTARTPDENLASATELVYNELGEHILEIIKQEQWPAVERLPVVTYIKSLVYGDGARPQELSGAHANKIEAIFVQLTAKRIVGTDVLPGQRQDWYEPMLGEYRTQRKAPVSTTKVTPKQLAEQLKRAN